MNQTNAVADFSDLLAKIRLSTESSCYFQGRIVNIDEIRKRILSQYQKSPLEVDDGHITTILLDILYQGEGQRSRTTSNGLFAQEHTFVRPANSHDTPRSRFSTMDEPSAPQELQLLVPHALAQNPELMASPRRNSHASSSFQTFWDAAFALFVNVASLQVNHDICFTGIFDILELVRKRDSSASPAILIALDIVVQRAMYELSDKVVRRRARGADETPRSSPSTVNSEAIQCVEDCVSIMHNVAIPMCLAEQAAVGLGFLAENTSNHAVGIGCKMSTLNRQLQELLAWTTLHNQSKLPINFDPGNDQSPPQRSLENMVDQTFNATINESVINLSEEVPLYILMKMSKVVTQQMGAQTMIQKIGSTTGNIFFCEDSFAIDFTANTSDRAGILKPDNVAAIQSFLDVEKIVEMDISVESALKHVKACLKDTANVSMEILRVAYQRYPELASRMEADVEKIQAIGNQMVDRFAGMKSARQNQYPVLLSALTKYEQLQECLDREEKERISVLRKLAKVLERSLSNAGFADVKNENSRARFVNLRMLSPDPKTRQNVPCTLVLESQLPVMSTKYVADYINLDATGKVKLFLDIIKKFIKSHGICDTSKGFLSSFAWQVLGLHVLMREQLLPNIHSAATSNSFGLSSPLPPLDQLRRVTTERFSAVSVVNLLDRFFRYYVEGFQLFSSVVTLRNQGETLSKAVWQKTPVLWRLSIEDPFELTEHRNAYDLGSTLSRPGQLTTFKALRRAIYGIASIMSSSVDICRANVKRFFSKTDLIHLARKSDYMGAIINPPKEFSRLNQITNSSPQTVSAFHSSKLLTAPKIDEAETVLAVATEVIASSGLSSVLSPRLQYTFTNDSPLQTARSSAPNTYRMSDTTNQPYSPGHGIHGNASNSNSIAYTGSAMSTSRSVSGFGGFDLQGPQSARSTRGDSNYPPYPSPRQQQGGHPAYFSGSGGAPVVGGTSHNSTSMNSARGGGTGYPPSGSSTNPGDYSPVFDSRPTVGGSMSLNIASMNLGNGGNGSGKNPRMAAKPKVPQLNFGNLSNAPQQHQYSGLPSPHGPPSAHGNPAMWGTHSQQQQQQSPYGGQDSSLNYGTYSQPTSARTDGYGNSFHHQQQQQQQYTHQSNQQNPQQSSLGMSNNSSPFNSARVNYDSVSSWQQHQQQKQQQLQQQSMMGNNSSNISNINSHNNNNNSNSGSGGGYVNTFPKRPSSTTNMPSLSNSRANSLTFPSTSSGLTSSTEGVTSLNAAAQVWANDFSLQTSSSHQPQQPLSARRPSGPQSDVDAQLKQGYQCLSGRLPGSSASFNATNSSRQPISAVTPADIFANTTATWPAPPGSYDQFNAANPASQQQIPRSSWMQAAVSHEGELPHPQSQQQQRHALSSTPLIPPLTSTRQISSPPQMVVPSTSSAANTSDSNVHTVPTTSSALDFQMGATLSKSNQQQQQQQQQGFFLPHNLDPLTPPVSNSTSRDPAGDEFFRSHFSQHPGANNQDQNPNSAADLWK